MPKGPVCGNHQIQLKRQRIFSSPINTITWIGVVFHQSKGIPIAQLLWQPLEKKHTTCSHYRTCLHTPNHKHIRNLISKLLHSFTTLIMQKQLFHSATQTFKVDNNQKCATTKQATLIIGHNKSFKYFFSPVLSEKLSCLK